MRLLIGAAPRFDATVFRFSFLFLSRYFRGWWWHWLVLFLFFFFLSMLDVVILSFYPTYNIQHSVSYVRCVGWDCALELSITRPGPSARIFLDRSFLTSLLELWFRFPPAQAQIELICRQLEEIQYSNAGPDVSTWQKEWMKSGKDRAKGPIADAHLSCNPIGDKEMFSHVFGPPTPLLFLIFTFLCIGVAFFPRSVTEPVILWMYIFHPGTSWKVKLPTLREITVYFQGVKRTDNISSILRISTYYPTHPLHPL